MAEGLYTWNGFKINYSAQVHRNEGTCHPVTPPVWLTDGCTIVEVYDTEPKESGFGYIDKYYFVVVKHKQATQRRDKGGTISLQHGIVPNQSQFSNETWTDLPTFYLSKNVNTVIVCGVIKAQTRH